MRPSREVEEEERGEGRKREEREEGGEGGREEEKQGRDVSRLKNPAGSI